MFGKHFASMYVGSMFGKPAVVFAVWGYAIAHQRPSRKDGETYVELNPAVLAATFSTTSDEIIEAIKTLCSPDPASRSQAEEGRRLVMVEPGEIVLGPTQFRVVNGRNYRAMRDEEERRIYLRDAKRKERSTKSTIVNHGQPPSTQAEEEEEEESRSRLPSSTACESLKHERKTETSADLEANASSLPDSDKAPKGRNPEVDWRIQSVWARHLAAWRKFFLEVNGAVPAPPPTLTKEILQSIRAAILEHDRHLLGKDDREQWEKESKARAAGVGIFMDPFCTGEHRDNDAKNGGKRYLEHWRPWKHQRGKGDPVDRFAELYFEAKSVRE